MTDLRTTIVPKSDQLNADSLIGGTMTIRVTKVSILGEADQPVAIHYEGDNGKPYKPCKSMRRVLVNVWGPDGNAYIGRSMTLYRDDKVTFGGMAVGGIRISHMSHIDRDVTMALTATRANRKPFTVKPLAVEPDRIEAGVTALIERINATDSLEAVQEIIADKKVVAQREYLKKNRPELAERVQVVIGDTLSLYDDGGAGNEPIEDFAGE